MEPKLTKFLLMLSLLSTFFLTGCFHIPDNDRFFSKNNHEIEKSNNDWDEFYDSINTTKQVIQKPFTENVEQNNSSQEITEQNN